MLKKKLWLPLAIVVFIFQLVLEAFAVFAIVRADLLPAAYLALTIGLFAALLLLNVFLLFMGMNRDPSAWRCVRRIFSVILALAVGFCSVYVSSVLTDITKTINNITTTQTISSEEVDAVIGVYVLDDDPAEEITDAADYIFALTEGIDEENTQEAVEEINSLCGTTITTTEYELMTDSAEALYSGAAGAIILNELYADMLEDTEEYESFGDDTRLLYEIEIMVTSSEAESDAEEETTEAAAASVDDITTTPFIVYLSGSDTRSSTLKKSRSDVNIIMAVNPTTRQILLLNTPRDYYVQNSAGNWAYDKLTHCGIYGIDCSISTLENLYDIEINYYIQLNFTGFETLIDDIGGITVYLDSGFTSRGYTFTSGYNTLDGAAALVLARERYSFATGDNERGKNQMKIITAVIEKLTSSGSAILTNYSSILSSLENMLATSLDSSDISALVKMQLSDMSSWNIKSFAVSGTGGYSTTYSASSMRLYVMYQNESDVAQATELVNKVLAGEILTDEDVE